MKKLYIVALLTIATIFTSCKKETLQGYLVESQNKKEFIYADIPTGIIELDKDKVSAEDLQAYKSIRKVNFTALPIKKASKGQYKAEVTRLKTIFKKSDYKELINIKEKGNNIVIYYSGDTDAIDEVIAFGHNKEMGLGIARLLGDKMNPNAIMNMMKKAKVSGNDKVLEQFKTIFNEKHKGNGKVDANNQAE